MAPANVGERPAIGSRLQRAVDGGAEGVGGALQDGPVQISQHADVVIAVPRRAGDGMSDQTGDRSRARPFAADVSDHHGPLVVGDPEQIVEVSADLDAVAAGPVAHGNVQPWYRR
jgi:hypothetical protein